MGRRALPWTDLMEALGEARFQELRDALAKSGADPADRDAFLLDGTAGALLRELVPEDAPSQSVTAYGALLHALYLCWSAGWPVRTVSAEALRAAISDPSRPPGAPNPRSPAYVQLPERMVWAEPERGASHEPVDGIFVLPGSERLDALAVLGLRPGRDGFTTMEAAAAPPAPPVSAPAPRRDGSAAFSPTLPGGDLARLLSIADQGELLTLALRALEVSSASLAGGTEPG